MPPLIYDFEHKKQTKMNDCWYASIQMLLSWRAGQKAKPQGKAVSKHRDLWAMGRTLSFGSDTGAQAMRDNGLVAVGDKLDSGDIDTVHQVLQKYGPFIVGGKYGPCGAGHFVVICGVNTVTGQIYRDNPAWGYGKAWKPLSYLKKAWTYGNGSVICDESAVALRPLNP